MKSFISYNSGGYNILRCLFFWHFSLDQLLLSSKLCCREVPGYSFFSCSSCRPFLSFDPSKYLHVVCRPALNTLSCSFSYRKSWTYLISKLLPVFHRSFSHPILWVFYPRLAWPSTTSFVFFVIPVWWVSSILIIFLCEVDSQCVVTSSRLQAWFVIFGPWWQNQRRKP